VYQAPGPSRNHQSISH